MNVRWLQGVGAVLVLTVLVVLMRGAFTPSVAQTGVPFVNAGATLVEDDGTVYVLSNGQLMAYSLEAVTDKSTTPPTITSKKKFVRSDSVRIP